MRDRQRDSFMSFQPLDYAVHTDSMILRQSVVREALRADDEVTRPRDIIEGIRNGIALSALAWLLIYALAQLAFS
jgi:hypothetical protein